MLPVPFFRKEEVGERKPGSAPPAVVVVAMEREREPSDGVVVV